MVIKVIQQKEERNNFGYTAFDKWLLVDFNAFEIHLWTVIKIPLLLSPF